MKKEKQKGNSKNPIKNTDETTSVSATQIPSLSVKQITFEKLFVFIAVLVGSLLVFLTPPIAVSDEGAHFINSYAVSKGDLFFDVQNGKPGLIIPQSYVEFINEHMRYCGQGQINEKYSFSQYISDSWNNTDTKEVFHISTQRMINPVGYFVSGLGMAVGSLLLNGFSSIKNSPYNLLLFGRMFNLMFYIIVTYYAIKITPKFKRSMVLLSLMPMSIFLAASLSYDAVIIPVSFLLFAYAMKLITSPAEYVITKKDIIAVAFIAFFLGGVKAAYLPFLLILLAVPRQRFGTTKRYLMCIGIVVLAVFVACMIPAFYTKMEMHKITLDLDKYEVPQKAFLASHMNQIGSIINNTIQKYYVYYLTSFFGELGWLGTYFPVPAVIIFYIVLIFTMLVDSYEAGHISLFAKLLSVVSILICIFGMGYHIYTYWTSQVSGIGVDYVSGLQGRYYIPIALFVFMLFSNSLLQKHKFKLQSMFDNKANYITVYTPAILGLLTVTTVLLRFW